MLARVLEVDDIASVRGVKLVERLLGGSNNSREGMWQVNPLDGRAANSVDNPEKPVVDFNVRRGFNEDCRVEVSPGHSIRSPFKRGSLVEDVTPVKHPRSVTEPRPFANDNEPFEDAA